MVPLGMFDCASAYGIVGTDMSCRRKIQEVIADDFHLRKGTEQMDSSDVVEFFKQAKKEGKQIWYFTAPANVPIEVVQKSAIALDKVQQRQPIFKYNGKDYVAGLDDGGEAAAIKVIIPHRSGVKYTGRKLASRNPENIVC